MTAWSCDRLQGRNLTQPTNTRNKAHSGRKARRDTHHQMAALGSQLGSGHLKPKSHSSER